ncbi:unnamed protein product [Cyprideis torosa]|uniref:Uncharacterized protein n=1 Tax=Cyprideis torosa TaxID=163714 RepID=A0A7R8ZRR6_9CRUS|nr:unnamed protein product [Cyprideis torosa]CAG0905352.1 unnamed protein product [Cyprideis torosa]
MNIVINISMMIQVVVNLTNSGGPSPHTRERRQRRTANVLGVRRRETFRRRQLSAQVLRGGAVVDQCPPVIPLPCPPSMVEDEVVRSSVECSSAIPLPCPPSMVEDEVVRSSVETSSAASTEEMNWEHRVSTPFSLSPVHQAGEWEQGVDTPHSPSPSSEERLNIKQEPITPAESPTPSSTDGEEEEGEGEGVLAEGSSLKEERNTPIASPAPTLTQGEGHEEEEEMDAQAEGPSTFSQGCLSYIQSVTQAWTSMEEEENVEVEYTTPSNQTLPFLSSPPPAPRRERSSHQYDNIHPRRLTFDTFDDANCIIMYLLTIIIGVLESKVFLTNLLSTPTLGYITWNSYHHTGCPGNHWCWVGRMLVCLSIPNFARHLQRRDWTVQKQRRGQELTVIYNASCMESIDEDDDMPRGPVPTLGDTKGPQLEEDEVSVISTPLRLNQKTSQVFTSPSPTPEGRYIPHPYHQKGSSPAGVVIRRGKRTLRYPSSLPLPPPTPPKSGVPRCTLGLGHLPGRGKGS